MSKPVFFLHFHGSNSQRNLGEIFATHGFGKLGTRLAIIRENDPMARFIRIAINAIHQCHTSNNVPWEAATTLMNEKLAIHNLRAVYVPGNFQYAPRIAISHND